MSPESRFGLQLDFWILSVAQLEPVILFILRHFLQTNLNGISPAVELKEGGTEIVFSRHADIHTVISRIGVSGFCSTPLNGVGIISYYRLKNSDITEMRKSDHAEFFIRHILEFFRTVQIQIDALEILFKLLIDSFEILSAEAGDVLSGKRPALCR